MKRPRLLDLCAGAGGCSMGFYQAGFEVVGVDNRPQPSYPFEFHLADALTFPLEGFDAYSSSPPCQAFTNMLNWDESKKERHPDLIEAIRARLIATGKPYVIENVPGAPVERLIMLCGAMFGLRVYRHRWFESNIFLFQPHHPKHIAKAAKASRIPKPGEFWSPEGCFGQKDDAQRAMGITWMKTTGSRDTEIAQAIPPSYTKWIGEQLMQYLVAESAGVA